MVVFVLVSFIFLIHCLGTINHAVYSLAMKKVYILSDNHTITTVDCTMTYLPAKYDGLTSLGCDKALPSSSLSSLTFTDTILDFAEPLIPALSSQFIPIVNNVILIFFFSYLEINSFCCESNYKEMFSYYYTFYVT